MRVVWLRSATESLVEAKARIAHHNPSAARAFGRRVEKAAGQLSRFPQSGRPGRIAGTRELVVPGTHYIVVYRVSENRVELLRVFHAARNLAQLLVQALQYPLAESELLDEE